MSDSDSFIREVTEEVERDRMNRQLKKWGPVGAVVILLAVGAAAAWQWQQDQERKAAEAVGLLLLDADPQAAAASLDELPDGAKVLARMRLAESYIEQGNREDAIVIYKAIAKTSGLDPAYADLASLRSLRLRALTDTPDEVISDLDPLIAEDRPYRLLAMELRAVLLLNAGRADAAHADMNAILDDPDQTGNLRARVEQLLVASGGTRAE
ncbi:MAG: hypothetical protein AAF526_04500 [Pseudomonadota bacterium]